MEDADIVQLYWDRNEKAISVTAQKYGKYCSFIAMNILGNKEDADECVNDAYLKAWNAIPPNKPAVLSTFLGKLTRNRSDDTPDFKQPRTTANKPKKWEYDGFD